MVKAYVLLKVKAGSEREVVTRLDSLKEVAEVSELYGDWDVIARLGLQKLEDLDRILTEKVRSISGIENSSTMIVAEYVKWGRAKVELFDKLFIRAQSQG